MRRPLCVVCLTFVLAISLFLVFFPLSVPSLTEVDGQECLVSGQVYRKESRSYFGSKISVIYLKKVSLVKQNKEIFPLEGVICYLKDDKEPNMGAKILVRGTLKAFLGAGNPGEFDLAQYYYIQRLSAGLEEGVLVKESKAYHPLQEGLYNIKKYFSKKIDSVVSSPYNSLLKAMLLGDKTDLDGDIKGLYKQSGILHILSVSGLHVSLIGMGLYRLLRRLGSKLYLAAGLSLVFVFCYGEMIGMGTSAFRAIVMFGLSLLAKLWGRTYDLLTALSVAAVLLLIEQPYYLYHSGFLLSFGSVLSIGLWYPVLEAKPPNIPKLLEKELSAFLVSLSIFLGTLPIHMWFYYETPLYGVFLNLLVIPSMTIVMVLGFFILLFPPFFSWPLQVAAEAAQMLLQLFEHVSVGSLQLPMATWITGKPQFWQVLVYYGGLLLLVVFQKKWKYLVRLMILAGLVVVLSLRIHIGLSITVLDVGQGDGIFLQTRSKACYLVDGGSSSRGNIGEKSILPYLKYKGMKQIDAIFVSHGDEDHCSGVKELLNQSKEGILVKQLVLPDIEQKNDEFKVLLELAQKQGIGVTYLAKGEAYKKEDLTVTCLHPPENYQAGDANAYSQVLLVEYKHFRGLFTGDVEGEGETLLTRHLREQNLQNITLLKVSHHGSKGATKEDFLQQISPRFSVISCGKNNLYGHPHEELLQRLEEAGSQLYRTDERGAIELWTDGAKVRIEAFR